MPKDSINKKLGRVRPPRVHITYDVYTGGAIEKREIPFVVGVLADLSGNPEKPLPKLRDRRFVQIDRDNFDDVMAKQTPRLAFTVADKLTNSTKRLGVDLRFNKMADFEPQNVVKQVPQLNEILELRTKLANLRNSVFGNDKLEELLQQAVAKTEAARKSSETSGADQTEQAEQKG